MLTYAQDTIRKNAAAFGRAVNNFLDCDFIQDVILKLEDQNIGSEKKDVRDSLESLLMGISYRTTKKNDILDMRAFIEIFDKSEDAKAAQL